jgi:predicted 3-demethylubiquinone-9 3-methyltransferase (glyoxalase superfamily)
MLQPTAKVTLFLWFDTQAEEAARFYVGLFPNSRLLDVSRRGGGVAMSATFEIDGRSVIAFNGGPHFQLNEACSLFVSCEDQTEVDHYWNALLADGGKASRCGWLRDRFGLSWQVVPKALGRLLSDPDAARAGRAMQAMMGMGKLEVAELERAAAGA